MNAPFIALYSLHHVLSTITASFRLSAMAALYDPWIRVFGSNVHTSDTLTRVPSFTLHMFSFVIRSKGCFKPR